MHSTKIAAIWAGGILLAVAVHAVGPDRFISGAWEFVANFEFNITSYISGLAAASFELLQALAVGLYAVFVLLSVAAIHQGLRARSALVVISLAYFFVVTMGHGGTSRDGWILAFLLAFAGAVSMTHRLLKVERPRARN